MIEFSRILNVASALLFIVGIVGVLYALQDLFWAPTINEGLLGVTASEIRDFNLNVMDQLTLSNKFKDLYMLSMALIFCIISLVPYRKGEKWAWYTALVTGGLVLFGQFVILYAGGNILAPYLIPLAIILIILWIVGLVLPVKEILSSTKTLNSQQNQQ